MRSCKVLLIVTATILSATFASGARTREIPFKLAGGFGIVIQGGIGPLSNLNFLVDTGAVPSVLSEQIAARIRVVAADRRSAALLHKDREVPYVTVEEVRVGPIRAVGLPMVIVDLARFESLLGTRIDAIIGLDILVYQSFGIDYKHGKITFGLSGLTRHVVPVEIHSVWGAPYWVIPIKIKDQIFRVLLDTGANDLALFEGHTPETILKLMGRKRRSASLLGETTVRETAQPLLLVIGNTLFKNQAVVVLKEDRDALPNIDGVLGPTALPISRIELDWEHKSVRWESE